MPVDAEDADDPAATQQADAVGHQLRAPGALHDEIEAADLLLQRGQRHLARRHVVRAEGSDELCAGVRARLERRRSGTASRSHRSDT